MGREVRMVPASWQHPKDQRGNYIPLNNSTKLAARFAEWIEEKAMWDLGLRRHYGTKEWVPKDADQTGSFEEWESEAPDPADFMPAWPDHVRTHLMMYEDTSEGTPLSPAFETPEELARWLTDNGASAFGGMTGTYEGWLAVARGGWAPSMILSSAGLQSGVDGMVR